MSKKIAKTKALQVVKKPNPQKEVASFITGKAKEIFKETGEFMPMVFISGIDKSKKDKRFIAPAPFVPVILGEETNTSENKQSFMRALAMYAKKEMKSCEVDNLFLATETWFVKQKKDEPIDMSIQPSLSPNRSEGLMISGKNKFGETYVDMYAILTDKNGKKTLGKKPLWEDEKNEQGSQGSLESPLLDAFWGEYQGMSMF